MGKIIFAIIYPMMSEVEIKKLTHLLRTSQITIIETEHGRGLGRPLPQAGCRGMHAPANSTVLFALLPNRLFKAN